MLGVADFRHVVVDFAALVRGDISRRVVTLVDEFLEKRIDFAVEGLSVKRALHASINY